jgi:hypothetical protein
VLNGIVSALASAAHANTHADLSASNTHATLGGYDAIGGYAAIDTDAGIDSTFVLMSVRLPADTDNVLCREYN